MKRFGGFSVHRLVCLSVLSLSVLAGSYFQSPPAFAQNTPQAKICYVDIAKVFGTYQRTKDIEKGLESKGEQKKSELEGQFNDLKKMRDGLELLSDQAKETKAREIEDKADAFKRLKSRSERELLEERNESAKLILGDIEKVIDEYAKSNGYAFILDQRTMLYGDAAYDATDAVLKMLNDRYASTSSNKSSKKQ